MMKRIAAMWCSVFGHHFRDDADLNQGFSLHNWKSCSRCGAVKADMYARLPQIVSDIEEAGS